MREALARSDHDFVLSEAPRPRKAPERPTVLGALTGIARVVIRLAAYPNRIAGALVIGLAMAIMVNALMLQQSRHPAPLFRTNMAPPVRPAPAPRRAPEAAAIPASAQHTGKSINDPIGQLITTEDATLVRPQRPQLQSRTPSQDEKRPSFRDAISRLLTLDAGRPQVVQDPPKTVFAVQEALIKLGFVLKADGKMGAITRRAIEQYEHAHGLLVRGELSPELIHLLTDESGVRIN